MFALKVFLVVMFVLSLILKICLIDCYRKPITKADVIIGALLDGAVLFWIFNVMK